MSTSPENSFFGTSSSSGHRAGSIVSAKLKTVSNTNLLAVSDTASVNSEPDHQQTHHQQQQQELEMRKRSAGSLSGGNENRAAENGEVEKGEKDSDEDDDDDEDDETTNYNINKNTNTINNNWVGNSLNNDNNENGNSDTNNSSSNSPNGETTAAVNPRPAQSGDPTMKSVYKAADYIVAVHRQLCRQDSYFLQYHKTRPMLFGVPLLVPCYEGCRTNKDLYCAVWIQVARFLSPLPPTPPDQANHATDCDDSLGYEFPFTLKAVAEGGRVCAFCAWSKFCRGCEIPCNDEPLLQGILTEGAGGDEGATNMSAVSSPILSRSGTGDGPSDHRRAGGGLTKNGQSDVNLVERMASGGVQQPTRTENHRRTQSEQVLQQQRQKGGGAMGSNSGGSGGVGMMGGGSGGKSNLSAINIAIDWDPTALYLRYQSTREKMWNEHASVALCRKQQTEPVDLDHCLRAFTSEERLEESYHCSKCNALKPATKKLQIWKLPPILVSLFWAYI